MEENNNALATRDNAAAPRIAPLQIIDPARMPNLDAMEEGVSLQVEYMQFNNAGETVRGIFVGFTTMISSHSGDVLQVANFQTSEGVFCNSGANLILQLKNVSPGTPIQITYMGTIKTNNGQNCKKFEVKLLTPSGGKSPVGALPVRAAPRPAVATVQKTPGRPAPVGRPVQKVRTIRDMVDESPPVDLEPGSIEYDENGNPLG